MISSELKEPVNLYNEDGSVNYGWSRKPVYNLNFEKARFMKLKALQRFRTKKWDYYYIFTDEYFFSITLADLGYAGMAFAYIYDYADNNIIESTIMVPFASGFVMAPDSNNGRTSLENKSIRVVFDVDENARHIVLNYPGFNGGEGLEVDVLLQDKGLESICVATPIEGNKMNYTRKICCMGAKGHIRRGNNIKELNPERDLGGLDWSRGFLATTTFWNWCCSSAYQDGHKIGLNLCFGLNDTRDTENAFFIDNRCYKVDAVKFDYDEKNRMNEWHITSSDGRVDLTFTPEKERIAKTDVKIVKSEVHQMFGRYSGHLVMDNSLTFKVDNIRGAIEDHHATW